jgi:hypothetical protein
MGGHDATRPRSPLLKGFRDKKAEVVIQLETASGHRPTRTEAT